METYKAEILTISSDVNGDFNVDGNNVREQVILSGCNVSVWRMIDLFCESKNLNFTRCLKEQKVDSDVYTWCDNKEMVIIEVTP